jgi:tRNA modification GTPase
LATEVEGYATRLSEILEELAASLDFPDEVEAPSPAELACAIEDVDAGLAGLAATWEAGRIVREGAAVVIVGPPNAGKSSLLNALLGADRALVSPRPGTTRDTVEELLSLGNGLTARLIDTAGLRPAADELEAAGMARSEAALATASLALVVVDGAAPLDTDARAVLRRTREHERIVYFNKADLGRAGYDAREAPERDALFGSVRDAAPVAAIRAALAERTGGAFDAARPMLGTARQADAVLEARRALGTALATLREGAPSDLIAGDLAAAHAALGQLTGRDASEALLDAVFARFCLGK